MKSDVFYKLGLILYRKRWFNIFLWVIFLLISIPFAHQTISQFKHAGLINTNSESFKAAEKLANHFGYGTNRFIIMYQSSELTTKDQEFLTEVKQSLAGLKNFPIPHIVKSPIFYPQQISQDKHIAYAIVLFKSHIEVDPKILSQFKQALGKPKKLKMLIGGDPAFIDDAKKQTQQDLYKAEYIATPVAILTMLFVFGSIVAASLPVVLSIVGVILSLTILFIWASIFELSVFTLNISILLSLCLTLDYSLLFISRFRQELKHDKTIQNAIAITQATAGKSIFFSALAVFVSLSALLLFPINFLFSVGIGGLTTVTISLLLAIVLLPSIISVLGERINKFSIPLFSRQRNSSNQYMKKIIIQVTKRPAFFFIVILLFLLLLGYPFLHVKLQVSDFKVLPKNLESRKVYDTFISHFGENELTPIFTIIETPQKNILTVGNVDYLYDFAHEILKDFRVKRVDSIVTNEPRLLKEQYKEIYGVYPRHSLDDYFKNYLLMTTKDQSTLMIIISQYGMNTQETFSLIEKIRNSDPGNDMQLQVTGFSASVLDLLNAIWQTLPLAITFVIIFTYIVLLVLFHSIFLPLKAIIMNILSLFASYGVLVLIFQDGYLSHLLGFEPLGSLDISLLVLIFCGLFGISMDYEVFLLSSIKEYYEKTNDNITSIILGVENSSRIITNAALVLILVCLSFITTEIVLVKAFGIGIAVAVFVDAFFIRLILAPSTMCLLKKWNWYVPNWLNKLLPNLRFT